MIIQELASETPTAAERYRLLVESIVDYAVYMLDPNGIVASWNPGAQRFKGYASEEIIGSHFSVFYTPEDREGNLPMRGLETAAKQGRFETEGWRVRNDGSRFWAHVIIDPIRDDSGCVTGFAKVTRDVTERYEAQRELDTAREALFQAQKMEAVGRLTGGVAHDFNNLLTVIMVSLNLAKKRAPDSPVIELIDNALQGAERGAAMTQRMLAFSRRQPLQLEALSLPELVEGLRPLIRQSIDPATKVQSHFSIGLPAIRGDRNQLETVLLNLVINARDAMPNGGEIVISGRVPEVGEFETAGLVPTGYVVLEVTDTGEGMDDITLQRAVEPFFTTKGVGKGTGLGLSMAHGVVEQTGGKLKLISAPGEGTTVQLWLPVSLDSPIVEDHTTSLPGQVTMDSLRVLVVDDDELVLTNTCALLEELGHQTFPAQSAEQALEVLQSVQVGLVITDHAMPHTTGSEMAEQLKRTHPGLPVILASGYAEVTERIDAALPTLSKPFDEASLAQAIQMAMGGRAVSDPGNDSEVLYIEEIR